MLTLRRIASKPLSKPFYSPYRSYYLCSDEDQSNRKTSADKAQRELILSVLEAQPSARDSRLYLKSFGPTPKNISPQPSFDLSPRHHENFNPGFPTTEVMPTTATLAASGPSPATPLPEQNTSIQKQTGQLTNHHTLPHSILTIPLEHTGLVKIQGPFNDRQLQSIVDGVIYLKTLGLVSIIILDHEAWYHPSGPNLGAILQHQRFKPHPIFHSINPSECRRRAIIRETARLSDMLEARGASTRPFYGGVLRLTDERNQSGDGLDLHIDNLNGLKSAIKHREIPIIPPIAINSSSAMIYVSADEVVKSLAQGLAKIGKISSSLSHSIEPIPSFSQARSAPIDSDATDDHRNPKNDHPQSEADEDLDLTPLRLMIINREGGIPSLARSGHPHLSINLASEYEFINETFKWSDSHPTSLANLSLARSCLKYLPNESSAIIVSHRSPKSLIANLITNKPAHSPSLKHSILLHHTRDNGLATPTLIRKGLPIRVIRGFENIDQTKMKNLLEQSFNKTLDHASFFHRLQNSLRFVILAGDYQGAAIVTNEGTQEVVEQEIVYLDKFAVLPSLQGEGIVDFLWGALRDESFGLGNLDALNNNGGLSGIGQPVDLVWRSRTDNPVNRWYFERSNGFIKLPRLAAPPSAPHSSATRQSPPQSTAQGPSIVRSSIPSTQFSLFWCWADHPSTNPNHSNRYQLDFEIQSSHTIADPSLNTLKSSKLGTWCRVINQIPSCWIAP